MEQQEYNAITALIKSTADGFGGRLNQLQTQLDAVDKKLAGGGGGAYDQRKSLKSHLEENPSFQQLLTDRRGVARLSLTGNDAATAMQRKTTITSPIVGWQTTGVLPIERTPGITAEPRQTLTIRDALSARPTTYQVIDFVKVLSPMTIASPVSEGSVKPENAVTFVAQSERVKTIATWIPASRQVLEDFTELAGFLQSSLSYYVDLDEEIELLLGDGTGERLHGLIPQASAFNNSLLVPSAGYTRIDIIGRAIQQILLAKEIPPTFVVLPINDWWSIRLAKDSLGRYLLGDPQSTIAAKLFDLDVIATTVLTAGQFLVGSGNPAAAEIRDRMELQYEISTEHSDYWVRNLCAARAEKRLALVVKRPGSFVTGTLTSSPAS